jgi:transmembrane sensor
MENIYPFQSSEEIKTEARAWVLKFNGDAPPDAVDVEHMREWAERSPAHRAELERATQFWCDADRLSALAVPLDTVRRTSRAGFLAQFFASLIPTSGIGALASVASLVVMVVFASWAIPMFNTVDNGVYYTIIGEQKILSLKDGSKVQLDTDSRVRINYTEDRRKIHLLRGKAYFDVAKNKTRPFEVYAGRGMVRAVGTAFSVYLNQRDIDVTVNEGRVDLARVTVSEVNRSDTQINTVVEKENTSSAVRPKAVSTGKVFLSLGEGQSARFNDNSQQLRELKTKELSRELAWRKGLLIFNGKPLSEVVSEVSRYTATNIEITDPELSKLKIGGRFRAGELEALFDVLEAGFDVQVSYVAKDHIQLRSAFNQ